MYRKLLTFLLPLLCLNMAMAQGTIPVTGVKMDETSSLTIMVDETVQLNAYVLPEDATNKNLIWESTNESCATVDDKGLVKAVGVGKTIIRAKSEESPDKFASRVVNVKASEAGAGSLIINEIQVANLDMFLDPSFNYGGWIELYNTTSKVLSVARLYISDDPENLKKHHLPASIGEIPAHGYKALWFDHYGIWNMGEHNQVPFKLNYDGGTIIISDGTNIIAQQDYPQAVARTSYARKSDGSAEWGTTYTPTPEASNDGSKFATEQLAAPVVDKDAQLFTGTLQVRVTIPSGATLRYTTNGSTPTLTNGLTSTTGVFSVNKTTPYRFRLFKDDMLPSQVVTRTYIYNDKDFTIPIISVNGSYEDLHGNHHGVFTKGTGNGRPGAGQTEPCNWNMDWDRPVNFEYIGNEGDGGEYRMLFNQEVDLSRCGGWSRAWTPYSFKLRASKQYYGLNALAYPFFPDKPNIKNKTLQIRNGGNDAQTNCRIIDAALQEIVSRSGLYLDGQEWVPVMHFINGEYRGVINMREPNNKHFAYANYGIDTDEMDQFEISPDSNYVQMEGTKDAWNELYKLAKDAANPDTYEEICKRVDIDELLNYLAVQLYLGGDDWPKNNLKGFRDRNEGKFHFVLFDLDHAFNKGSDSFTHFKSKQTWQFDQLRGSYIDGNGTKHSLSGRRTEEIEFVTIVLNLFKNEQFKRAFIDRFCVITGSVFEPNRCKEIVTEMATTMEGPMSYTHATSGGGGFWWGPQGDSPWNSANKVINNLSTNRISSLVSAMASFLNVGKTRQSANISSNVSGAVLTVNDFEIPTGKMNGYLYSPVTLAATPLAGYKFKGWTKGNGEPSYKTTTLFANGDKWSYYDGGSLDGTAWKTGTLGTGWKSGATPIGYNSDKNLATLTAEKRTTYYFRTTLSLDAAPSTDAVFTLDFDVDDGCVVYVNGKEAGRFNMPQGSVSYNTFATSYVEGVSDPRTMTLPTSLFTKGDNIIAVEVHNNSASSSDAWWNATLTLKEPDLESVKYVSTEAEYKLPSSGSINLVAVYEPMTDAELATFDIKPVMINEVSAANSIYVNDYYKKNDWIELYNTTNADIDIAGMYVSDNENKPQKYQVPTDDVHLNTIIPAHGYKVLWADKLDNIGADIHTSFKLAAEEGVVMISTDEYTDMLKYVAHAGNQTFGRYPDGSQTAYVMNIPTIGKANTIGLYDTEKFDLLNGGQADGIDVPHTFAKDGSIAIAYTGGVVNAKSEDSPIVAFQVYATSGMKMNVSISTRSADTYATARVADLPQGVYIVRVLTADGNECHIKFMKK